MEFRSTTEALDTTNKDCFYMPCALAEFERSLIRRANQTGLGAGAASTA
jgi:hypothetical protein